jgi:hypothetical protein
MAVMKALLEDQSYLTPEEYARDIFLMLENCRYFNKQGEFVEMADRTEVRTLKNDGAHHAGYLSLTYAPPFASGRSIFFAA